MAASHTGQAAAVKLLLSFGASVAAADRRVRSHCKAACRLGMLIAL